MHDGIFFFSDFDFKLTRYCLKNPAAKEIVSPLEEETELEPHQALLDIMSRENIFIPVTQCTVDNSSAEELHPLSRWYGLRDFLVLSPAGNEEIMSESKAKVLLSSVCMAVNNTNW